MSIIIKARPASARPATLSHVSFGAAEPMQSIYTNRRPASAYSPASVAPSTEVTPRVQSPRASSPPARSKSRSPTRFDSYSRSNSKPPFRPASAHPRDATFYSSTYMNSATSGVSQREKSPTRQRSASAVVTSVRIEPASATPTPAALPATNPPHIPSVSDLHSIHSTPSTTYRTLGGTIPVRHTRRTSEAASRHHAHEMMNTMKPSELTENNVRTYYEPILQSRQQKFSDLKARYRKQEQRLQTMQSWKGRALDQANSEPNSLDYVLAPDGGVVESLRVRQKRIILQRTLIRQFLRTFRLLRALKLVHRHLRTMLPLLIESPNSRLHPDTRMMLRNVLETWGKEPVWAGLVSSGGTGPPVSPTRRRFEIDHEMEGSDGEQPMESPRAQQAGSNAAAASEELSYYRAHPHSHTSKLLANLFDVVPLLQRCLSENLEARHQVNQRNLSQFTINTQEIQKLTELNIQINERHSAISKLREDVELLESEIQLQKNGYESKVVALESIMRQEQILLRKLNHLYYREVSEKLGEPYAVQLALVQQGYQPFLIVVQKPPPGLVGTVRGDHIDEVDEGEEHAHMSNQKNQTQLFLPSTFHGLTLPQPPRNVPEFIGGGTDTSNSLSASIPGPTLIPLTPSTPLVTSTNKVPIHRGAVIRAVDRALEQNPDRPENLRRTLLQREKSEREHQERQSSLGLDSTTTAVAADELRFDPFSSSDELDDRHDPDAFSPFFILKQIESGNHETNDATHIDHTSAIGEEGNREYVDDDEVFSDLSDDRLDQRVQDELFSEQRDHFNRGIPAAINIRSTMRVDITEEEEKQPSNSLVHHSSHHRPHSSVSRADPTLAPPAPSIPPLHVRTLSEIDWSSSGPVDSNAMAQAKRRKHLSIDEREAYERQAKLTNPFVHFDVNAMNDEDDLLPTGENQSRQPSHHQTPSQTSSSTTAPAIDWWSRKAVHAPVTPTPPPKPKPAPKGPPPLPPSLVPGMSSEVYDLSFKLAVSSLLKLGYPPQQALDFAPHLVLTGVVEAPVPKVEQITEPNNVAMVAQQRIKKRAEPPPPAPPPFQQAAPVSEELAWIGGLPGGEPYVFPKPTANTEPSTARPTSAVPSHHRYHSLYHQGALSARGVVRPRSAVGGAKSARFSAAESKARMDALVYGLPSQSVAYKLPVAATAKPTPPPARAPEPPRPVVQPQQPLPSKPTNARRASLTGPPPEPIYVPFLLSPTSNPR